MPSSTSNSEFQRVIPDLPWRGIAVTVAVAVLIATAAWEVHCRAVGYEPTLNNTEDLWAQARRRVEPESIVIVGDSRAWFDMDLDELERGLGKRPVQLALPGSCAYPVLADLADDPHFHGTVLCSIVPRMFFAPGGPLVETSTKAVRRYHGQTWAQRVSHHLSMPLEESFAFLKQDDITLSELLKDLPIPDRPNAQVPPRPPPYFCSVDHERRARMVERCAQPGPLQEKVKNRWLRLFTPPPPPSFIPADVYAAKMREAVEARYVDTKTAVDKLRARGGKIIFIRFPMSSPIREGENEATPRAQTWDRLLQQALAPGIHFEDFPELSTFICPEWSHLSAGDSVEFTKRLVPHLREALQLKTIAAK
ncbi:MAG: hypothetical protein M3Z64_06775 [Verrucomicrobiota bacterium]|nr:hypothetical protein [Verrucomicrobiota bacterium]